MMSELAKNHFKQKSVAQVRASDSPPRYLYGRVADFLLLGGGSLLVMPILYLVLPNDRESLVGFSLALFILANFINYPHFAHSYQIFYRNFANKIRGISAPRSLQLRYIFSGLVVPAALIAFFGVALVSSSPKILGYGGNLMALLVGWHYVKQGYGMLMLEAVLKRRFFNDPEKKILISNAYMVWIFFWILVNDTGARHELWGIEYFMFQFPVWLVYLAGILLLMTSAMTALMLIRKEMRSPESLPKNGVLAYVTSSYVWLLAFNLHPALVLAVPAFHSLQYLAVVWRFELNRRRDQVDERITQSDSAHRKRVLIGGMAVFIVIAIVLGNLGFVTGPAILQIVIDYNEALYGSGMFLFMFWIFINVHHYFLDNVMWRRENKDVARYLFS